MNIQGTSPNISAPLLPMSASSAPPSGSSSDSTSATSLEDTFLNLLVTELQNQDPTQPVDPTEMVGQMISLNQLDQLIAINQDLGGLSTSSNAQSQSASNVKASVQPATLAGQVPGTGTGASRYPATTGGLNEIPSANGNTANPSGSAAWMNLYSNAEPQTRTSKATSPGAR